MTHPFLIASRAGTTIMAGVFLLNWLSAPGELDLENAREWEVESHLFIQKAGRTSLLQARRDDRDVVSLRSQQEQYAARSVRRNAPLCALLGLAVVAWRWPRIAGRLRARGAS